MKEFKVNENITLKLENDKTNIYVNGTVFRQCKFLLLNIPVKEVGKFEDIESIDEAAEKLDKSLEQYKPITYNIPPETEFWAHCSNLQVWVDHNYDIRLLHSRLALPLLKKLVDLGDFLAKNVLKEEIAKRLLNGHFNSLIYYSRQNYLNYFNPEELEFIEDKINDLYGVDKFRDLSFQKINLQYLKKSIKNRKLPILEKILLAKAIYMLKNGPEEDFNQILVHRGFIQYLNKENYEMLLTNTSIKFLNWIAKIMSIKFDTTVSDSYGTVFSQAHLIDKYLNVLKKISAPRLREWLMSKIPYFKELRLEIKQYLLKEGYFKHINYADINFLDKKSTFLSEYSVTYKKRIFFIELKSYAWESDLRKQKCSLNLSNKNISDINDIKGLENLGHLKELNLSKNQISRMMGLEKLKKLEVLDLSENSISNIENLNNLINLRAINLSNNNILEIDGLEDLKNLQRVDLGNNKISKVKSPFSFKRYGHLELSDNKIKSLREIERIENIEVLHLDNNQISDLDISKEFNSLLLLSLKNNMISRIKNLDMFPKLETLYLDNNKIKIEDVSNLSKLRELHFT